MFLKNFIGRKNSDHTLALLVDPDPARDASSEKKSREWWRQSCHPQDQPASCSRTDRFRKSAKENRRPTSSPHLRTVRSTDKERSAQSQRQRTSHKQCGVPSADAKCHQERSSFRSTSIQPEAPRPSASFIYCYFEDHPSECCLQLYQQDHHF